MNKSKKVLRNLLLALGLALPVVATPQRNAQAEVGGYSASWDSQSNRNSIGGSTIEVMEGGSSSGWVKFKNTGTATWRKGVVRLAPMYQDGNIERPSLFSGPTWPIAGRRYAELKEDSVAPGQIGTFEFTLYGNSGVGPGEYMEYMALVAEDVTWFGRNIGVSFQVVLKPAYSHSWKSQSGLNTSNGEHQVQIVRGEEEEVWLRLKNKGAATWDKVSDGGIVKIGTSWPQDRVSKFKGSGWLSENRAVGVESATTPNNEGVFRFNLYAPKESEDSSIDDNTWYKEYFQPVAEFKYWMEDVGIYWNILVLPEDTRPRVQYAQAIDDKHVLLKFNKKVQSGTGANGAENVGNYSVYNTTRNPHGPGDITITSAELQPDQRTVILYLDTSMVDAEYTVDVQNVKDKSGLSMLGNWSSAKFQGMSGFGKPNIKSAKFDDGTYVLEITFDEQVKGDDAKVSETGFTLTNGTATVTLKEDDYATSADGLKLTFNLTKETGEAIKALGQNVKLNAAKDSYEDLDGVKNDAQENRPVTIVNRPYLVSASYNEQTNKLTLTYNEPIWEMTGADLASYQVTVKGTTKGTANGATDLALTGNYVSGDGTKVWVFEITNAADVEIGQFESGYIEIETAGIYRNENNNTNLLQRKGNSEDGDRTNGWLNEVSLTYTDDVTPPTVVSARYNASYVTSTDTGGILRVVFSEKVNPNWARFELKLNSESLGNLNTLVVAPAADQNYAYDFIIKSATDPSEDEIEAYKDGDVLKLVYTADAGVVPAQDEAFLDLADGAVNVNYYDTQQPSMWHTNVYNPPLLTQNDMATLSLGAGTPSYWWFGAGTQVATVIDSDASYDWLAVQVRDYTNLNDKVTKTSAENKDNYKVYRYGSTVKYTPVSAKLMDDGQTVILKVARPAGGWGDDGMGNTIVVVEAMNLVDVYGNNMTDSSAPIGFGWTKADLAYSYLEDTTAPEVTNREFKAVAGPKNDEVIVEVTDVGTGILDDSTLVLSNFKLYKNWVDDGDGVVESGEATEVSLSGAELKYSRTGNVTTVTITLKNGVNLEVNAPGAPTNYTLVVSNIKDYPKGNTMLTSTLTSPATGDNTVDSPTVYAYATDDNDYAEVWFDEMMDETTAKTPSKYTVNGLNPASVEYSYDTATQRTKVVLKFGKDKLPEGVNVAWAVNGVKDLALNAYTGAGNVVVGDKKKPTVKSTSAVAVLGVACSGRAEGCYNSWTVANRAGKDYLAIEYSELMKLGVNDPQGVNNLSNYVFTHDGTTISLTSDKVQTTYCYDGTEDPRCDNKANTFLIVFKSDSSTNRVNLQYGKSYSIKFSGMSDASGNVINTVTLTGTVGGDNTFIGILGGISAQDGVGEDGGRGIRVDFTEDVKTESLQVSDFALEKSTDGGATWSTVSIVDLGRSAGDRNGYAWVVLNTADVPVGDYRAKIKATNLVEDIAGNGNTETDWHYTL